MAKAAKAQAAPNNGPIRPIVNGSPIPPARDLASMEHADAKCGGPQIIDVPKCAHCGSDRVKIVSTQGVPVNGKRWQRQKYRCADAKCKGHTDLSVVMRGPFGVNVAGDRDAAARVKLDDHRKPTAKQRSQISFAGG